MSLPVEFNHPAKATDVGTLLSQLQVHNFELLRHRHRQELLSTFDNLDVYTIPTSVDHIISWTGTRTLLPVLGQLLEKWESKTSKQCVSLRRSFTIG